MMVEVSRARAKAAALDVDDDILRSISRTLFASGAARLFVLPLTGVVTLVMARLITAAVGVAAFGPVMLIATLSQLLVFADLGAGAAVATASAQLSGVADGETKLRRTVLTSLRALAGAALVLSVIGAAVALCGGWAPLLGLRGGALGSARAIEWTAASAVAIFGFALPLSLGEAILRGTGHMPSAILLTGISAPLALALALALRALKGPHLFYALTIPLGAFLASVACFVSARRITNPSLSGIAYELLRPRRFPGLKISTVAGPWFIIMVGLPIALQTDRIVISHRVSALALSDYSYVSQLYSPIWSVLSLAALSLWPTFAASKVEPRALRHRWLVSVKLLGGTGVVFAAALALLTPVVVNWTSDGNAHIGIVLVLSFAGLLLVQALHVGTGLMLIAPDQLRFQAVCVCVLVVVNLPLSWFLAEPLGASGPVVASIITVALCQAVPGVVFARRVTSDRTRHGYRGLHQKSRKAEMRPKSVSGHEGDGAEIQGAASRLFQGRHNDFLVDENVPR